MRLFYGDLELDAAIIIDPDHASTAPPVSVALHALVDDESRVRLVLELIHPYLLVPPLFEGRLLTQLSLAVVVNDVGKAIGVGVVALHVADAYLRGDEEFVHGMAKIGKTVLSSSHEHLQVVPKKAHALQSWEDVKYTTNAG